MGMNEGSTTGATRGRLLGNRPFVLYSASFGISSFAFWGFFLAVVAEAAYRYGAQSFQLASEVVEAYDGDYEHFRSAKSTLVKAVIQLAGECSEHLRDPSDGAAIASM